jgi:Flp pilus assembly protein TadB
MGNGISRTYPVGIIKPVKQIRFGKPEVREYSQDSWESVPLLNTHETRRIEAKIKAAATAPMPRPKPPDPRLQQPVKKSCEGLAAAMCTAGTVATIFACIAGGPVGVLVPVAFIAAFCLIKWAVNRKAVTLEYKQEQLETARHLSKLAQKSELAGLPVRAQVYRDMAAQCRRNGAI